MASKKKVVKKVTAKKEEVAEEPKIPDNLVLVKNPTDSCNIDITYEKRIYLLPPGEERLFEIEVADFLIERYPFLRRGKLTPKSLETIAKAIPQVSPFANREKKKAKSTFDPLQDRDDPRIPYYGPGMEDDTI